MCLISKSIALQLIFLKRKKTEIYIKSKQL